ncbi:DNA pilot protein [Microviridae sp.]|nr:DNA pilot protein [Microviridae sp.]
MISPGWGTVIGAGIGAGASMLQGSGVNWRGKYYRNQMSDRMEWEPKLAKANMIGQVEAAKAAGLHPLFALGKAGQSAGFSMPGQAPSGSHKTEALKHVGQGFQNYAAMEHQKDLVQMQGMLSALRIAENTTQNDKPSIVRPEDLYPELAPDQELELGKVQAHYPGYREQNKKEISPMTKMRIGSQDVWLPVEEADTIMEDPAAVALATFMYHGNRGLDWGKLGSDYVYGKNLPRSWTNHKNPTKVKVMKKALWGLIKYGQYYQRTGPGR